MLVMIDGRSIYSPAFGGVFWDQINIFLEDIQRIEIIRGPGATMWGTNAVNGVINIITKDPEEHREAFITTEAGTRKYRETVARYSGSPADRVSIALTAGYAQDDGAPGVNDFQRAPKVSGKLKYRVTDSTVLNFSAGLSNRDVRVDTSAVVDARSMDVPGGYGMLSLEHKFSSTSELQVQTSYHYGKAYDNGLLFVRDRTYNFNLQHSFALGAQNFLLWGMDLRHAKESSDYGAEGESATDSLTSFFLQDEFAVRDNLKFIGGIRFENNYATDGKWSPRACILYAPLPDHQLRFSVAQAYRTPSFAESKTFAQQSLIEGGGIGLIQVRGNHNLAPEQMTAYELGYRSKLFGRVGLNVELYYNNLEQVIKLMLRKPIVPLKLGYDNMHSITSRGIEVQLDMPLWRWWRLGVGYTYEDVETKADNNHEPGTPRHKFSVISQVTFTSGLTLDLALYYVDDTTWTTPGAIKGLMLKRSIDDYVRCDMRIARRFWHDRFEAALVGQNLTDRRHHEISDGSSIYDIERLIYGQITFYFTGANSGQGRLGRGKE